MGVILKKRVGFAVPIGARTYDLKPISAGGGKGGERGEGGEGERASAADARAAREKETG